MQRTQHTCSDYNSDDKELKQTKCTACDCSVSYSEANYNLGQADRAAAAPPALILHMFVVVVGP
jgi:hypothetical protein